ncbi:isoleucine patch superfamily acetyltransferase [Flavobacterium saliperosum S13]|uniref:Isoleucine patch superfamily acetyltransferase n=1 Tax=Flavobacterium saliperosum S13 TaxID=1341155 RepID=A0ABN0QF69_9FLAO|nr:isoleucine patch superfamily acetyltransferase [Flavobacterium saliperosum S13]
MALHWIENIEQDVERGNLTKLHPPYTILHSKIGKGTYISANSKMANTTIGKFCSIGPNLVCGWGIHPTNGISTSPYFYSIAKQNGSTIATKNLTEERKPIVIGNDVFIGANVTILDGVTIGDGAVIGAGAVVSKNIPDYAIAVGCPIQVKKYRFTKEQIVKLKDMAWWDFDDEKLKEINTLFFDVDTFISRNQ